MIRAIKEIGFGPGTAKSYATLSNATVSLTDMGDRTITAQVKIDGDIVPQFQGWELEFRGERFVLPNNIPPASKDNSTRCSVADLTFYSWATEQLKRYFFVQMASTDPENPKANIVADKYEASLRLSISDFVAAFNKVLDYYFEGQIVMDLYDGGEDYPDDVVDVEISHNKIWEVLTQSMYDKYGYRWTIEYDETDSKYHIRVNYPSEEVDHIFQYGYDGGLIRFERQIPDDEIKNIILGRGGEKNLPYRYFKRQDEHNPEWTADPDAIPELENIYFDRLRDINFRWYVRGWMTNTRRRLWPGDSVKNYDPESVPEEYRFAYVKGHEDEQFNPVEYVKDDESILRYGERWGYRDDDDDVYPTIQGIEVDPLGRIDEAVDVSEIVTDDVEAAKANASTVSNLEINSSIQRSLTNTYYTHNKYDLTYSKSFRVPEGMTGRLSYQFYCAGNDGWGGHTETVNTANSYIKAVSITGGGAEYPSSSIPPGLYYFKAHIELNFYKEYVSVDFGINQLKLHLNAVDDEAWKPTFDIWVKDIWGTRESRPASESDSSYSRRVWEPILGDKVGNAAKLVFSTGAMAVSSDYEFIIADYPVVDRTKTINGVPSEWRISLRKSDAEFDATGLWIPNAQSAQPVAGDKFFFTGIDMPFAYVEWAEEKLNSKKTEELSGTKEPKPTWVIGIDKVRAHTLEEGDYGELLADKFAAGAKLTIKDKRYTNNESLTLHAQSVTYTWQDGTVLVPDIEVVLSDEVVSQTGPIAALAYQIRRLTPGAEQQLSEAIYAKKIGGEQTINAPTAFGSLLKSDDFLQGGVGGSGWGLYRNGEGESILEVDRIMARRGVEAASIVANQVTYVGGKQIRSAASMVVDGVIETDDGYQCFFDQRHGTVANLFKVNDIAMGQSYDPENNETKYFRRLVTEVGENYIVLSKTAASGTGVPADGDTVVQFGNTTDPARQFVIISDVIGGGYEQMLSGLNSVSASGDEYYFAGTKYSSNTEFIGLLDKDGKSLLDSDEKILGFEGPVIYTSPRWFVGNAAGDYAKWEDGALTVRGRIYVRKSGESTYNDLDGYLDEVDYLQGALAEDSGNITTIAGGLVLSKIIGVVGDVYGSTGLVAALNSSSLGQDATHGTLMIFAGANGAQNASTAKFRVYSDGAIFGTSGVIGGWSLGENRLVSSVDANKDNLQMTLNGYSGGLIEIKNDSRIITQVDGNEYATQAEVIDTTSTLNVGGANVMSRSITAPSSYEFSFGFSNTIAAFTLTRPKAIEFTSAKFQFMLNLSEETSHLSSITIQLKSASSPDVLYEYTKTYPTGSGVIPSDQFYFETPVGSIETLDLPAGAHQIYVAVVITVDSYITGNTLIADCTFLHDQTANFIFNQKINRFFGNGIAIADAGNNYFMSAVFSNVMQIKGESGNAGIDIYNGQMKIKLNGVWYTCLRGSDGHLILST